MWRTSSTLGSSSTASTTGLDPVDSAIAPNSNRFPGARRPAMPPDTLVLKLVLTPLLIAAASLAGRRWGPAVSGWFVGLPLTSGPIAFFLALEHGVAFAAAAAVGALAGALA